MEVTQLSYDKKNGKLSFQLEGVNTVFSNAVRRAAIDLTPTMAIEEVEFKRNTGVLYDEVIAHRLGLIPLKTDLESYNLPSKCKCEGAGCARCQLKLSLKATGPAMVYASEITSKDPKIKPAFPEMLIVQLLKGQQLEFEATAILGLGEEHSKWSPGWGYYKYKPTITINKTKCTGCSTCISQCPKDILELKNKKAAVKENNLLNCHLCAACQDSCEKKAIEVGNKSTDFVFYVESWGQLDCKEIIETAAGVMKEKFEEFQELIKG